MISTQKSRHVYEYLRQYNGREMLSAPGVASELTSFGLSVAEIDQGEEWSQRCMVIDGRVEVPLFTDEDEIAALEAEGRGGYVERTPEYIIEVLHLAEALFLACFPKAPVPQRYLGRGNSMRSVVEAFQQQLDHGAADCMGQVGRAETDGSITPGQ